MENSEDDIAGVHPELHQYKVKVSGKHYNMCLPDTFDERVVLYGKRNVRKNIRLSFLLTEKQLPM